MRQHQLFARSQLKAHCTNDVSELLRTDLDVDGYNQHRIEMENFASMLGIDAEMDMAVRTMQYKDDVEDARALHSMDVAISSGFKSLLQTDQEVDGKLPDMQVVDHIARKRKESANPEGMSGSLLDVADMLLTDMEVDRDEARDDLILHLFGLPAGLPPSLGVDHAGSTGKIEQNAPVTTKGDDLIGQLFGLGQVPGLLVTDGGMKVESNETDVDSNPKSERKKFGSFLKKSWNPFFN